MAEPDPRDKRFADPEWTQNQFFDFLKQAYLLTVHWADHLVADANGLDPHTRHKAEFYLRQIANAVSPSNFVLTNPELLRETLSTNADNLARGMHMLAEDIQAGHGDLKIRQSDAKTFEVGRNLALTPGQGDLPERADAAHPIRAVDPTVLKRPLLIVPPWINKFYILDLTPDKSFIKWCVDHGLTVFVDLLGQPGRAPRQEDVRRLRGGPLAALDVVEQATGESNVHAIGYCVGRHAAGVTLAHMATAATTASPRRRCSPRRSTSPMRATSWCSSTRSNRGARARMGERGYLEGSKMANAFNMLRSNDLIWPYVINNYLRGKEPMPFDLLFWNSDATRMPSANHSFYLRGCYLKNKLTKGEMVIGGGKLDLKKVKVPLYNLATREDHIAPAKSALLGSNFFGGPVRFVLAGSGHIAGVVNPPGKVKYQYWTGGKAGTAATSETWLEEGQEHPGSWWPDWFDWIKARRYARCRRASPAAACSSRSKTRREAT